MTDNITTTQLATVLVVEDHDLTQKLLANILGRSGYQVITAAGSSEAMQLISDQHPDVIVCDLHLPNGNGLAVLRYAMSQPHPARVIVLTGDNTTEPVVDALRAGAHDYLLKPCAPEVLLQSVANALTRRQRDLQKLDQTQQLLELTSALQHTFALPPELPSTTPPPLVIGQISIRQTQTTLSYHGRTIHLTPVEHKIIYKLIEAHGEVVPFSTLAEYTYHRQIPSIEAQSLLKPHIWKIRQKTHKQLIVTIWGIGYHINTAIDQEENTFSIEDEAC